LAADQSFGVLEPGWTGQSPGILTQPTPGALNDTSTVAPEFLSFAFGAGGEAVLTWSAVSGRSYRLECKEDLAEAAWQEVGQVTASSSAASLADGGSVGRAYRFYRIIVLP
jgi:hypothetical protein